MENHKNGVEFLFNKTELIYSKIITRMNLQILLRMRKLPMQHTDPDGPAQCLIDCLLCQGPGLESICVLGIGDVDEEDTQAQRHQQANRHHQLVIKRTHVQNYSLSLPMNEINVYA